LCISCDSVEIIHGSSCSVRGRPQPHLFHSSLHLFVFQCRQISLPILLNCVQYMLPSHLSSHVPVIGSTLSSHQQLQLPQPAHNATRFQHKTHHSSSIVISNHRPIGSLSYAFLATSTVLLLKPAIESSTPQALRSSQTITEYWEVMGYTLCISKGL
jgi:hypothetical protein